MHSDQLTPDEMEAHIAHGTFRLAFVGMSNAGKSYRSRILQSELDFYWYEVDVHIQSSLELEGMGDVSAWLGYPTSPTYAERAKQYLAAEEKSTHLAQLDTHGKNLVFDTTGSVIYLSSQTIQWLRGECLVVHIDVGEDSISELSNQYFAEPKPVLWGSLFNHSLGEDTMQALRRCYPDLLRYQLEEYRKIAHLTIPLKELYDKNADETLEAIKKHL